MNDSVSLYNLVDESTDFMFIHGPDFVKTIFIALFKALEFILKFLELFSELLIVIGQLDVISLEILRLSLKLFFNRSQYVLIASIFSFQRCNCVAVDLFSLLQYLVIKLQLFLIQAIDRLHILHALFEYLHFLLELNLLLGLIVSILASEVFELLGVVFLILRPLMLKVFLELPVLLEQPAYLVLVILEYLTPLIIEGLLNVVELVAVVGAHLVELKLHRCDQEVDVVVLVLQRVHILVVLGLQLLHKLANETLLLLNDLRTCVLLLVDVLKVTVI